MSALQPTRTMTGRDWGAIVTGFIGAFLVGMAATGESSGLQLIIIGIGVVLLVTAIGLAFVSINERRAEHKERTDWGAFETALADGIRFDVPEGMGYAASLPAVLDDLADVGLPADGEALHAIVGEEGEIHWCAFQHVQYGDPDLSSDATPYSAPAPYPTPRPESAPYAVADPAAVRPGEASGELPGQEDDGTLAPSDDRPTAEIPSVPPVPAQRTSTVGMVGLHPDRDADTYPHLEVRVVDPAAFDFDSRFAVSAADQTFAEAVLHEQARGELMAVEPFDWRLEGNQIITSADEPSTPEQAVEFIETRVKPLARVAATIPLDA